MGACLRLQVGQGRRLQDLEVHECQDHLRMLLQYQQPRIHILKTLRRMKLKGRRSQKENRKNQKLPRSPNLQRSPKRRVLKGKRKKKRQKSRKSVAGSPLCITTMRATLLRRSPSRK